MAALPAVKKGSVDQPVGEIAEDDLEIEPVAHQSRGSAGLGHGAEVEAAADDEDFVLAQIFAVPTLSCFFRTPYGRGKHPARYN